MAPSASKPTTAMKLPLLLLSLAALLTARLERAPASAPAAPAPQELGTQAHLDRVMQSAFCADCHPAIYAEHEQNTHGRAFVDMEARLATRGFRREDCVRCHTPRPVFETGIGMTPMVRYSNLEDGNGCMSCHWKQGFDYSRFAGGPECKGAFDPRVGTVEACASCHRIAGTPAQWSHAEHGKEAGRVCLDCHMPEVERPVAVGGPVRYVRSHVFPASRSESQLRRAYGYDARIEGSDVVVTLANKGAGHNFPTATRQRSVESLVVVRDLEGNEVSRSRMTLRYPYASDLAPQQLTMPQNTQIPSGKSREQRVPLHVASGTVECTLFFKLYHPIEDEDPELSRRLEDRRLVFDGVEPSDEPVDESPEPVAKPGKATPVGDVLSTDAFPNFVYPEGGKVEMPEGSDADAIQQLVAYLSSPLPEARALARKRLRELGSVGVPALVDALGAWNNETFNEARELLVSMGEVAAPALRDALDADALYVRCHARDCLTRLDFPGDRESLLQNLLKALDAAAPLDRRSAADTLGALGDERAAESLRARLDDVDWDVVAAAALALARLGDRASVDAIEAALGRATYCESRRDLGYALGLLGSPAGIPALLNGLMHEDERMREAFFDRFFELTGMHEGFDPGAPELQRLEALARLRGRWAAEGGADALREPRAIAEDMRERAWELVETLGGGTDTHPGGDDALLLPDLVALGSDALPALIEGFSFPAGFVDKRVLVCEALGRIGDRDAAPYLAAALRDPYLRTAEWACWALESAGDAECLPAVGRFEARVRALDVLPDGSSPDRLIARAVRTRYLLGDLRAQQSLVDLLLSDDLAARQIAIGALEARTGERRGYDPEASLAERTAAVARWNG